MNENIKNIGRAALLLNEAKKILDDTPEAITAGGLWGKVVEARDFARELFMHQLDGGVDDIIRFYVDGGPK